MRTFLWVYTDLVDRQGWAPGPEAISKARELYRELPDVVPLEHFEVPLNFYLERERGGSAAAMDTRPEIKIAGRGKAKPHFPASSGGSAAGAAVSAGGSRPPFPPAAAAAARRAGPGRPARSTGTAATARASSGAAAAAATVKVKMEPGGPHDMQHRPLGYHPHHPPVVGSGGGSGSGGGHSEGDANCYVQVGVAPELPSAGLRKKGAAAAAAAGHGMGGVDGIMGAGGVLAGYSPGTPGGAPSPYSGGGMAQRKRKATTDMPGSPVPGLLGPPDGAPSPPSGELLPGHPDLHHHHPGHMAMQHQPFVSSAVHTPSGQSSGHHPSVKAPKMEPTGSEGAMSWGPMVGPGGMGAHGSPMSAVGGGGRGGPDGAMQHEAPAGGSHLSSAGLLHPPPPPPPPPPPHLGSEYHHHHQHHHHHAGMPGGGGGGGGGSQMDADMLWQTATEPYNMRPPPRGKGHGAAWARG